MPNAMQLKQKHYPLAANLTVANFHPHLTPLIHEHFLFKKHFIFSKFVIHALIF